MKLIKDFLIQACAINVGVFCQFTGIDPADLYKKEEIVPRLPENLRSSYADVLDFATSAFFGRNAQTIIFNTEQIMGFLKSVDRKLKPGDYPCPFDSFFIQFTKPIPEKEFLHGAFTSGLPAIDGDSLLGLLVAAPQKDSDVMHVVGIYASTSINRVAVEVKSGELLMQPITGLITPEGWQDKERLVNLALLCIAYINSPKVVVEKVASDPKVNKKREAKGKRKLEEYYVCHIRDERIVYQGKGGKSGRHVSVTFPVIGHFRQLGDGRVTWVRPHMRGVEHSESRAKVYKVGNDHEQET